MATTETTAAHILIIEDEPSLRDGLRFNLEAEGYTVEAAADGERGLKLLLNDDAGSRHFDLVLLDVMLPGIDGFAVARKLRHAGQFVPILMLTARGRAEDVLRGFEAGADDYLPKPFELKILLARLRGLLRRREWMSHEVTDSKVSARNGAAIVSSVSPRDTAQTANQDNANQTSLNAANGRTRLPQDKAVCRFDDKLIDFAALELHAKGRTVRLTLMETELLYYLIVHTGKAVSRGAMLEDVWNLHEDTDTRAIDNFIVRLRKYIEDQPQQPKHLLTVRSVGYRFVAKSIEFE